jgi:hypothetical protein
MEEYRVHSKKCLVRSVIYWDFGYVYSTSV